MSSHKKVSESAKATETAPRGPVKRRVPRRAHHPAAVKAAAPTATAFSETLIAALEAEPKEGSLLLPHIVAVIRRMAAEADGTTAA